MTVFEVAVLAILIDSWLGEPRWLWSRVPHPVGLMRDALGRAAPLMQSRHPMAAGLVLAALVLVCGVAIGAVIALFPDLRILELAVVTVLVGFQASLCQAGYALRQLEQGEEAARGVAERLLRRDTGTLKEPALVRGFVEKLGETSCSWGVSAVVWYLIAGLPGLVVQKFVTIGVETLRTGETTNPPALAPLLALDRLLGWLPARLSAAFLVAGARSARAWQSAMAEGYLHPRPVAGWPMAALAGALGISLGGPRGYTGIGGVENERVPVVNPGDFRAAEPADLVRAILFHRRARALFAVAVLALAVIVRVVI